MPYELKKSSNGKFMFNLKAGNHEIILTSELYEQKASALNGIASVRENSPKDENYEMRRTTSNQPYFVLKSPNGQVIGKSESYSSDSAAKNGIESVKKNGGSKDIDDKT